MFHMLNELLLDFLPWYPIYSMEPTTGFEPVTSPLPRKCSTNWATWADTTRELYQWYTNYEQITSRTYVVGHSPPYKFHQDTDREQPPAIWSWRLESNQRPTDYKSVALPTELRQHLHFGAGSGTRTRNLQLGRLPLYQLSYSRNFFEYSLFLLQSQWWRE